MDALSQLRIPLIHASGNPQQQCGSTERTLQVCVVYVLLFAAVSSLPAIRAAEVPATNIDSFFTSLSTPTDVPSQPPSAPQLGNADRKPHYPSCPAGKYEELGFHISGAICHKCPLGRYGFTGVLSSDCTAACPAGRYGDCPNGCDAPLCETEVIKCNSCKACPIGKHAPIAGAKTVKDCEACRPGRSSIRGSKMCSKCSSGLFSMDGLCNKCAPGTYQEQLGQSHCTTCPMDKYSHTGFSRCVRCPRGKFAYMRSAKCEADNSVPNSLQKPKKTPKMYCPMHSTQISFPYVSMNSCRCNIGFSLDAEVGWGCKEITITAPPTLQPTPSPTKATPAPTIHCKISTWGTWSICTESPGQCKEYGEWGGKQSRARHMFGPLCKKEHTGKRFQQTRACTASVCAQKCARFDSSFGPWSVCSAKCGRGVQHQKLARLSFQFIARDVGCPIHKNRPCTGVPCASSPKSIKELKVPTSPPTLAPVTLPTIHPALTTTASPTLAITPAPTTSPTSAPTYMLWDKNLLDHEAKVLDADFKPVDCMLSAWSPWSTCSQQCWSGVHFSTRKVIQKADQWGRQCPVDKMVRQRSCNEMKPCPSVCNRVKDALDPVFGVCNRDCGLAIKFRSIVNKPTVDTEQIVAYAKKHGCPTMVVAACEDMLLCDLYPWVNTTTYHEPVHKRKTPQRLANDDKLSGQLECSVAAWSHWGACSQSCAGGVQFRYRSIITRGLLDTAGAKPCPPLRQGRNCSQVQCVSLRAYPMYYWDQPTSAPAITLAEVCTLSMLAMTTPVDTCSASCGGGVQTFIVHPKYQRLAKIYGCPLQKHIICNAQPCAVDTNCYVSSWGSWSGCSNPCLQGIQTRSRTVIVRPSFGQKPCPKLTDCRECNVQKCIDSNVTGIQHCDRGVVKDKGVYKGHFGKCSGVCAQESGTQRMLLQYRNSDVSMFRGCPRYLQKCCTVTCAPTVSPTLPTPSPTAAPSTSPTPVPSFSPTLLPSPRPSSIPTFSPTSTPSFAPSQPPTSSPSLVPTIAPSLLPTIVPTSLPTMKITPAPTAKTTARPTHVPSIAPTIVPSVTPTMAPTTSAPTLAPSAAPTHTQMVPYWQKGLAKHLGVPLNSGTARRAFTDWFHTRRPTQFPTIPTAKPTSTPTSLPTFPPTQVPSKSPTAAPPTSPPSNAPTLSKPTPAPTYSPTPPFCQLAFFPDSKVTVGTADQRLCGGTVVLGSAGFRKVLDDKGHIQGIRATIDSSACSFSSIPQYVASIQGGSPGKGSWKVSMGFGTKYAIVNRTTESFEIHVISNAIKSGSFGVAQLSQSLNLAWIGDSGKNTGNTVSGRTGWRMVLGSSIEAATYLYVDVNTKASGFRQVPKYFTSLELAKHDWRLPTGARLVHCASKKGFRVFLRTSLAVTPSLAEALGWSISFIGLERGPASNKGAGAFSKSHSHGFRAGASAVFGGTTTKWRRRGIGRMSVADVCVSKHAGLQVQPLFFTSIAANSVLDDKNYGDLSTMFDIRDGMAIYNQNQTNFQVYLECEHGNPQTAGDATRDPCWSGVLKDRIWRIEYIAYQPVVDCKVGDWGGWEPCKYNCSGSQTRSRAVVVQNNIRGQNCPGLTETRACAPHFCPPKNCEVMWSKWSICSASCGGGVKFRKPIRIINATYGGKPCLISNEESCNAHACGIDCEMGSWSAWSPPHPHYDRNGKCLAENEQHRVRNITRHATFGGRRCAIILKQGRPDFGPCVGKGRDNLCGSRTIRQGNWKAYGSQGLYMDFDTSMCAFESKPQVFVSLQGNAPPVLSAFMSGSSSIEEVDSHRMRYTIQYPAMTARALLAAAARGRWHVAWIAGNGVTTGITTAGRTGWKQMSKSILFVDIHLSDYLQRQSFLSSLRGSRSTSQVQGANVKYKLQLGIRIYLVFYGDITPVLAEQYLWVISWVGAEGTSQSNASWVSMNTAGSLETFSRHVELSTSRFMSGQKLIHLVCIESQFTKSPDIVGGIMVSGEESSGFTVWVGGVKRNTPQGAHKWSVNYLSFAYSCDAILVKSVNPVDRAYFGFYVAQKNVTHEEMLVYQQSARYMAGGGCRRLTQAAMHSIFWQPGPAGGYWFIGKLWQGKVLKTFAKTSNPIHTASVSHITQFPWLELEHEGSRFEVWKPSKITAGCTNKHQVTCHCVDMKLKGQRIMLLQDGDNFHDPGVVAKSLVDGDISNKVVASGDTVLLEESFVGQGSCMEILKLAAREGRTLESGHYTISVKPFTQAVRKIKVYCDMSTDGGGYTMLPVVNGYPTRGIGDPTSCAGFGMQLAIPRTKSHFIAMMKQFGKQFFTVIPGIYATSTDGITESFSQTATMNSEDLQAGKVFRALDGGSWWIRDMPFRKPTQKYKPGCWFGMTNWEEGNYQFDDGNCAVDSNDEATSYICSTNDKGGMGIGSLKGVRNFPPPNHVPGAVSGMYTITYTVRDSRGNEGCATLDRIVLVRDSESRLEQ